MRQNRDWLEKIFIGLLITSMLLTCVVIAAGMIAWLRSELILSSFPIELTPSVNKGKEEISEPITEVGDVATETADLELEPLTTEEILQSTQIGQNNLFALAYDAAEGMKDALDSVEDKVLDNKEVYVHNHIH